MLTTADVKAVYDTDRDDDALLPFIAVAQAFSDDRLASKGLSAAILKEVQRYLAAHFLYVTDTGVHDALRVGDVQERFTKSDKYPGLLDSRWGRMAVTLDPSGTLAAMTRPEPPALLRLIRSAD